MPSVDELLLNGIDTLDDVEALEETNKYCEIDETGRVIVLNDLAEILGVENDKAVERVYFRCPRYVGDNVDLDITQCTVYINFQNANMDKDQYIVTDLDTDETDSTKVTFSWLLSKKVTQYKGIVNFIVCARKTKTGGEIEQEWNTTLAKATVLEGLEPDPYVVPSDDLDVVNQLMDLVKQEIEQKGQETIDSIPDDYVTLSDMVESDHAELTDVRVGADGKTYASAGEAVRKQYSILDAGIYGIENAFYNKKIIRYSNTVNFSYKIKKGKTYKINVKSYGTSSVQVGTIKAIGSSSYVDSSPLLDDANVDYNYIFRATDDANFVYLYRVPTSADVIVTVEVLDDFSITKRNAISIYEFLGVKDSILSCDSWNQESDHISLVHDNAGPYFTDGAVAQKYSVAYDRVITYDFVPYEDAIICGYTQTAGIEPFWKQGYCISVNFGNKTLNVHNKYGNNDTSISTTLGSIQKSISLIESSYIGKKHRLVIERTDDRGLKVSLYSLIDYSLLAVIFTNFEALVLPDIGLGYDYPSFAVLHGSADLYYLGIKIKKASNCFLYIIGDSLTEGVAVEPSQVWSYMVAEHCPNTIVSGRGGATVNSIIKRLTDECSILKPKYVMVMIGTNAGNTKEKLQNIISKIEDINAIPIINCIPCTSTSIQSEVNNEILALSTYHVRMDIATALDYNLNNGPDTSLFLSDGVHINGKGYERMYKRVLSDCPFLFD